MRGLIKLFEEEVQLRGDEGHDTRVQGGGGEAARRWWLPMLVALGGRGPLAPCFLGDGASMEELLACNIPGFQTIAG
jgi:hypothetical protein